MRNPFGYISRFTSEYYQRLKSFNKNIRLFILYGLLAYMGVIFWGLLFTLYLQEAGYDKKSIGDVLMVSNIAMALFALPAGYLVGRYNPKRILVLAAICSALAFIGTLSTLDKPSILVMVFLEATMGTFIGVVSGPFIMNNSTATERTYIFSISFIIMQGGGLLGNIIAGAVKDVMTQYGVPSLLAYRYTILSGVLLSVVGIIPLLYITASGFRKTEEKSICLSEITKWNWRLFLKATIPPTLISIGAGLIVQFMNLYFKDTFKSSDSSIGFYMSLGAISMAVGGLIAPILAEKIGKVNTIVGTELVSIPFMIVLALTRNIELAVVAFVLRATLMNMGSPISSTLTLELCRKEEQGILNALSMTTWSASWALSAWLFGQVFKGNYTVCFFVAVVLYFIAAILYYLFFHKEEKKLKTAEPFAFTPEKL